MNDKENKKGVNFADGFILWGTYHLFNCARQISLFQQIRNMSKAIWNLKHKENEWEREKPFVFSYFFSDLWVLGNLLLGVWGCFLNSICGIPIISWIFMVYAFLRMFEIFVYQVNVLLFDPIKYGIDSYKIKSATRTVLLLVVNMMEYIVWFTITYIASERLFFGVEYFDITNFLQSFLVFTNLISPDTLIDAQNNAVCGVILVIAYVESLIGMFMNILCLARFVGMLPEIKTVDGH